MSYHKEVRAQAKVIKRMQLDADRRGRERQLQMRVARKDPLQRLWLVGLPAVLYPDPSGTKSLALEGPLLMAWNLSPSILIDRFDIRTYVSDRDVLFSTKHTTSTFSGSSGRSGKVVKANSEDEILENLLCYERFSELVEEARLQNDSLSCILDINREVEHIKRTHEILGERLYSAAYFSGDEPASNSHSREDQSVPLGTTKWSDEETDRFALERYNIAHYSRIRAFDLSSRATRAKYLELRKRIISHIDTSTGVSTKNPHRGDNGNRENVSTLMNTSPSQSQQYPPVVLPSTATAISILPIPAGCVAGQGNHGFPFATKSPLLSPHGTTELTSTTLRGKSENVSDPGEINADVRTQTTLSSSPQLSQGFHSSMGTNRSTNPLRIGSEPDSNDTFCEIFASHSDAKCEMLENGSKRHLNRSATLYPPSDSILSSFFPELDYIDSLDESRIRKLYQRHIRIRRQHGSLHPSIPGVVLSEEDMKVLKFSSLYANAQGQEGESSSWNGRNEGSNGQDEGSEENEEDEQEMLFKLHNVVLGRAQKPSVNNDIFPMFEKNGLALNTMSLSSITPSQTTTIITKEDIAKLKGAEKMKALRQFRLQDQQVRDEVQQAAKLLQKEHERKEREKEQALVSLPTTSLASNKTYVSESRDRQSDQKRKSRSRDRGWDRDRDRDQNPRNSTEKDRGSPSQNRHGVAKKPHSDRDRKRYRSESRSKSRDRYDDDRDRNKNGYGERGRDKSRERALEKQRRYYERNRSRSSDRGREQREYSKYRSSDYYSDYDNTRNRDRHHRSERYQ